MNDAAMTACSNLGRQERRRRRRETRALFSPPILCAGISWWWVDGFPFFSPPSPFFLSSLSLSHLAEFHRRRHHLCRREEKTSGIRFPPPCKDPVFDLFFFCPGLLMLGPHACLRILCHLLLLHCYQNILDTSVCMNVSPPLSGPTTSLLVLYVVLRSSSTTVVYNQASSGGNLGREDRFMHAMCLSKVQILVPEPNAFIFWKWFGNKKVENPCSTATRCA